MNITIKHQSQGTYVSPEVKFYEMSARRVVCASTVTGKGSRVNPASVEDYGEY